MEYGKVCIGFSRPWIAKYNENSGVVTYTNAMRAARGVSVEVAPNSSSDNKFRADDVDAESADGVFTGGTTTLVVDGFFKAAARLMFGWPEADGNGWTHEGDEAVAPYTALGFIAEYMSGGVRIYTPYIIRKGKFGIPGTSAQTEEQDINWQTQSLEMSMFRDDTPTHDWRWTGADFATKDAAEEAIKEVFGVVEETVGLTALTIGSLDLSPAFDIDTLSYSTTTSNATNTITATPTADANVVVTLNGDSMSNGGSATWSEGANEVKIAVSKGAAFKQYTVTVTKEE